jgi:hypothetical protein
MAVTIAFVDGRPAMISAATGAIARVDGLFGLHGTVLTVPGDQHCRRQECG